MIDMPKIVRDFLLANDGVWGCTEGRVYAERDKPPQGHKPGDGACVVLKVLSGGPDYEGATFTAAVQFKCYAGTERECYDLYRTLYDALDCEHDATVLHATTEMLGHTLEERESQWPFTVSRFRLIIRGD